MPGSTAAQRCSLPHRGLGLVSCQRRNAWVELESLYLARPERFELPTNWFEASYSIQLSYGRVARWIVQTRGENSPLPGTTFFLIPAQLFQCGKEFAHLVQGFLVFLLPFRIRHYAAASPAVNFPCVALQGADGDIAVHSPVGTDVEH